MLSEGGEEIPFITHLPLDFLTNNCAGTARATSSIIKSGQKDSEASILSPTFCEKYP